MKIVFCVLDALLDFTDWLSGLVQFDIDFDSPLTSDPFDKFNS